MGDPERRIFFLGALGTGSVTISRFRPDPARPGPTRPDPTGNFVPRHSALVTADFDVSILQVFGSTRLVLEPLLGSFLIDVIEDCAVFVHF